MHTNRWNWARHILLLLGTTFGNSIPGSRADPLTASLRVEWAPRTLRPGGLLLLRVKAPGPISSAAAVWGGTRYPLEGGPEPEGAFAILGLDLEAPVAPAALEVTVQTAPGPLSRTVTIPVAPGNYPVDRLTVAPEMAEPPPAALVRIEKEERLLDSTFARRTGRKFPRPFQLPVKGGVSSSFGRRRVFNGKPKSPHAGADIRSPAGRIVKACNDGTVALTPDLYFAGRSVILDHGLGIFSHCAHLSAVLVKPGQRVRRGEPIGRVGMTGRVTGPHLHWAIRLGKARVSPRALLELPLEEVLPSDPANTDQRD